MASKKRECALDKKIEGRRCTEQKAAIRGSQRPELSTEKLSRMLIWLIWVALWCWPLRLVADRPGSPRPFTFCSPDDPCQEDNFCKQRIQDFDDLQPSPGRAAAIVCVDGADGSQNRGGAGLRLPG